MQPKNGNPGVFVIISPKPTPQAWALFAPKHLSLARPHSTHEQSPVPRKRILILGGGFGGVYAAMEFDKQLRRRDDLEVTLVSSENFLLFTPLLHEVAAGDLYPGDIVNPLRQLLRKVRFVEAEVDRIDLDAKRVHATRGLRRRPAEFEYDYLLLAVGSEPNFFGINGLADNAVTMKSLSDAALLRNRMLAVMELAVMETDTAEREKLLTFVAAGGGFAGVETIGAVNDFVKDARALYPDLKQDKIRVVLIHPGDVVLPELGEKLGRYTQKKLGERDVEVLTGTRVTSYDDSVVVTDKGHAISSYTLIWSAGVKPAAVIEALPLEKIKGRVKVDNTTNVAGRTDVWAVGDCAAVPDFKTGKPQPGTAQHGLRQAVHAARNILATIDGRPLTPFKFSTLGQLASVGHRCGVANIFGLNFSGFLAWWMWRTIYLLKLPRLAKKARVAAGWTLDMIFSRDFGQLFNAKDVQTFAKLAKRFEPDSEPMAGK